MKILQVMVFFFLSFSLSAHIMSLPEPLYTCYVCHKKLSFNEVVCSNLMPDKDGYIVYMCFACQELQEKVPGQTGVDKPKPSTAWQGLSLADEMFFADYFEGSDFSKDSFDRHCSLSLDALELSSQELLEVSRAGMRAAEAAEKRYREILAKIKLKEIVNSYPRTFKVTLEGHLFTAKEDTNFFEVKPASGGDALKVQLASNIIEMSLFDEGKTILFITSDGNAHSCDIANGFGSFLLYDSDKRELHESPYENTSRNASGHLESFV